MLRFANGVRWALGISLLSMSMAMGLYGLIQTSWASGFEPKAEYGVHEERVEYRERREHERREHEARAYERRPEKSYQNLNQYQSQQPATNAGSRETTADRLAAINYQAECGSCHLAYPPRLLPAVSWATLMSGLADHFGENAELAPVTTANIARYLVTHSAPDRSRFARYAKGEVPLRISGLPYFRHEHHELSRSMVTNNPEVGSFSNCGACHQRAEQGKFSERYVSIPGYRRWDD